MTVGEVIGGHRGDSVFGHDLLNLEFKLKARGVSATAER
jgi:hypothetical protein